MAAHEQRVTKPETSFGKMDRQVTTLAAVHRDAARAPSDFRGHPTPGFDEETFVIASSVSREVMHKVKLARSATDAPVLITGESGTGKELVAHAILLGGSRASRPFVPINCSAIPGDLAESLLFGHRRGAFTGAVTDEIGYFELADSGTLFLDEIADMPIHLQTKLLCVLDSGWIRPIGAHDEVKVDVRIIAATNADLPACIEKGTFRSDLYYRLAVYTIDVPPLRQRKKEITRLAEYFVDLFTEGMKEARPIITTEALACLQRYDYPGNVRELKNIIQRAVITSRGDDISVRHLEFLTPPNGLIRPAAREVRIHHNEDAETLPLNIDQAEAQLIAKALQKAGGNVSQAARLLGIDRSKLYRKMASLPVAKAIQDIETHHSLHAA